MMKEKFTGKGIPNKITRDDVDKVHIKYIKNTNNLYAVSDEGVVYSFTAKSHGYSIGSHSYNGYKSVYLLYKNGKRLTRYIHRLVAEAFLRRIPGKSQVHHINENRSDNRLCNLMYCTEKENCNAGNHNITLGKSISKYYANKTHKWRHKKVVLIYKNEIVNAFINIKTAAEYIAEKTGKSVNSSRNQISRILNNKAGVKTVGGFEVRELSEEEYNDYKKKVKSTSQQSSPGKN